MNYINLITILIGKLKKNYNNPSKNHKVWAKLDQI